MNFNKIINNILKEEVPSREARAAAMQSLNDVDPHIDFVYEGEFEDDHQTCCAFTYKGIDFVLLWCGDEAADRLRERDPEMIQSIIDKLDNMIEKGKDGIESEEAWCDWGTLDWA